MAARKIKLTPVSDRLIAVGVDAICVHIASGDSLRSWAIKNGYAIKTVNDWIDADPERAAQYARAREDRADTIFESLDDVSESAIHAETAVQSAGYRLKADTIKWKLARMSPKKYGDRLELDHTGAVKMLVSAEPLSAEDWEARYSVQKIGNDSAK